jgi:transcription elongation factor Elf1
MESIEKRFKCPYCFQRISFVLDTTVDGQQVYIEDCEVCCQPIEVTYDCQQGKLESFQNRRAD